MNFFEQQDKAVSNSKKLIVLFILAVVAIIAAVYFPMQWFAFEYVLKHKMHQATLVKDNPIIWSYSLFWKVALGTLAIIIIGSWMKIRELAEGGQVVAHMMNGRLVDPATRDLQERKLMNVVEEMSIAAGIPVPNVYLLDREFSINAFAAGYTVGDAVIGVTRGTIDKLNREELQGVIAHEFSHILHGDMKLNIKLMGLLYGILSINLIGRAIISFRDRRDRRSGGPLILGGIILMIVGWIGYLFGRVIQAAVARQREFLADASAVQYTRNADGIGNALKIIGGYAKVPATGSHLLNHHAQEISHMTFGSIRFNPTSGWFSSHPRIEERIKAVDPHFRPEQQEKQPPLPYAVTQPSTTAFEPQRKIKFGDVELPTSQKLNYGASTMLGNAGTIPILALAHEQQWLSSMDETVQNACRETNTAKAVMYILIAEYNDEAKAHFQKLLHERDPQILPNFEMLWEPVKKMGYESRLKLLDLSVPALRKLSPSECKEFIRTLVQLVELDQKVTMPEYLLVKILQRHLRHHFAPSKTTRVSIYDVYSVQKELIFLLCTIASHGNDVKSQAQSALNAGLVSILPKTSYQMKEINCDYKQIDAVLKTLRKTSFSIRKEILDACAKTAMFDQTVTWSEAELLRAIGDTLDCPLPPMTLT